MSWITHPLIKPERLEKRDYQLSIAMRALDGHTLVVLPTGLGKTAIALLEAASRLLNEGGKILMLAPTKPLVEQHLRFFERYLSLPGESSPFVMFTGDTTPLERKLGFASARAIFATPQVIKNDLIAGSYTLEDVSLVIIDECHRAVGNYAYVFIAKRYLETGRNARILSMTASPGGQADKVQEVCRNLGIEIVETRTEQDRDVIPYIYEREIEVITVELPQPLKFAVDDLNTLLDSRILMLSDLGFSLPKRQQLSMKSLHALNAQIQARISERDPAAFGAASLYAECMKLRHAIALAESQGSRVLASYIHKLFREGSSAGSSKASLRLAKDPVFIRLMERSMSWEEELHPKMDILTRVTTEQLSRFPESRVIIFATFRDMVQQIVDSLNAAGIPCERFVGQATKDAEKGLTQKKQIDILQRFRSGEFKVLVATSVGEEGLDVPSTDMVVFYEAVPSEIRSIQRKGRTGRSGSGKIVVLVTKGTTDETFRFVSQSRERAMISGIRQLSVRTGADTRLMQDPDRTGQVTIGEFVSDRPSIVVDDRETSSRVVEILSGMDLKITLRRLEYGDYAIAEHILIEKKTSKDFIDTLVERDLFGQLKNLAEHSPKPVLIIEGGDLYTHRDIHPNAIRGTLAAIAVDLGISLLFTRDENDTAQMIFVLAKRAQSGDKEARYPKRKAYHSVSEEQEMLIASFPDIGLKNARILLDHFKSVQAIVNASENELVAVKGIGQKKAHRIFELCRRTYR